MSTVITPHSCFICSRIFTATATATLYCPDCHNSALVSDTSPPPTTATQTLVSLSIQIDLVENVQTYNSYVPRPTPAATSFINTLKKEKLPVYRRVLKQLISSPSCAICSDEFKLKDSVNKLPCRHWFHHDCIGRWLSLKNNCPLCRHEFPRELDHHVRLRSPPLERAVSLIAAAVQGSPVILRRQTARIRAGAMLPNRRLAER